MTGRHQVTARGGVVAFLAALCAVKVADGLHRGPWVVTAIVAIFAVQLPYVLPRTEPFRARHWMLFLGLQAALTYPPFAIFGAHWIPGVSGLLGGSLLLALPRRVSWAAFGAVVTIETALGITVLHLTAAADVCYLITATLTTGLALYGLVRLAWITDGHHRPGPAAAHLARIVIVTLCAAYAVQTVMEIRTYSQAGGIVLVVGAVATAAIVLLQLHHCMPRSGTVGAWPWTLGLQILLTFALVSVAGWPAYTMAGLVAGSLLLLLPTPWSLIAFAAALACGFGISPPAPLHPGDHFYVVAAVAAVALSSAGLSRFAELAVRPPARLRNLSGY